MPGHRAFAKRSDVEGLRAVAILLVVLYHVGVSTISGGFIGVDVFFVISGYLIGGIITKEISNGEFSFRRFYCRRIRRIAPALMFMLLCVSIICYLLLSPLEFRDYAKYATAVLLSLPNIALLKGSDFKLTDNLCSEQGCMIFNAGVPVYFDQHHLSAPGSMLALGSQLQQSVATTTGAVHPLPAK